MADDLKTYRPDRTLMLSISKDEIENADDYGDIFDIADTLGVDLGGLDEIEDMKTRLLLYYKKCEGEPNYKDVIGDSMVSARTEDKKKREKLIKLLTETRDKLGPFSVNESGEKVARRGSALIKGFLQSEGTIQNLDEDLGQKLDALKHGSCTVVVSGETSAGKSTILNLMFGEEVLPTFHGSCTSVITKVTYYRQRRAKLIYQNGKIEKIKDIPQGQICKCLEPYLFVKDEMERDRATLIKEVVIYVPAKILECGLVVVDSPGIGENVEMDKVIINFVNENQINGFLYAIKSDNAGGVDEDRLLELLKVILEREKEKTDRGMLQFDPHCALFVCNMWDNIREDQDEIVFNHAFQRLKSLWPNMTKSQMMKFSAHKAKTECEIDPDFIIDNYKELLGNVKDLYCKAMDRRIKSTYKWLETVLKRSVHHLKTLVHRIDSSEKNLDSKMKSVWDKLNTLKMKSELVINDLKKKIEHDTVQICNDFKFYLTSPKTKMAITSWIEGELPDFESYKEWAELKQSLNDLIIARISKELETWEDETGRIKSVKDSVEASIQSQLNILEDELQDIEDDMQSDTTSIKSNDSSEVSNSNSNRRFSLPITVQMQISRVTLPVKLANRILMPFGKAVRNRASVFIDKKMNEGKIKDYKKDPINYAKRKSEKILQAFLNDERGFNVYSIIDSFMQEPKNFLLEIHRKLPAMVETNQQLMDHICRCRKEGLSAREMYENMMENLEQLKRTLTDYGEGYIYVNDFRLEDIQIITDTGNTDNGRSSIPFNVSDMLASVSSSTTQGMQKLIPRGLWTAQQNGIIVSNGREDPVTIRIYLPNARIQNTDSEVAKLRLLRHEHVAELLGIQHSNLPTSAFVFTGNLTPLRRLLKSRFVNIKEDVPRILLEILQGLEYIHRKKMIHMELNLNTVTVDENAIVKLCGACQPKVAALPHDMGAVLVGDFVYISPSVLQGDLYVACDDIYAFGLLVFEILVGPVFKDQRQWSLAEFAEKCQPYAFNGCPYSIEGLLDTTKEIIQDCLDIVLEKRPLIDRLTFLVKNIKNDPALVRLKKRTQPIEKVRSNDSQGESCCFKEKRSSLNSMSSSSCEEQSPSASGNFRFKQDNIQIQNNSGHSPQSEDPIKDFFARDKSSMEHAKGVKTKDMFASKNPPLGQIYKSKVKNIFGNTKTSLGSTSESQTDVFDESKISSQSPMGRKRRAPQLIKQLSTEAERCISEKSKESGSQKKDVIRALSDSTQKLTTDDSSSENLMERLTKSLDNFEIKDRQSPSQLRQS